MPKHWTDKIILPTLIAGVFAFLYWRYQRIFACPSCFLFLDEGDGLKNYFTPAWWVSHDSGLWFTGMNYPYGEHPVYTDNQPAWSVLMKLMQTCIPMRDHVVGLMNMLMLLSIVVGVIAVYLILRHFKLPQWYAAIVSLPIVFLSPQLDRFNGHFSLAYVCYLPLFLLFFIKWVSQRQSLCRGIGLVAWITWMGFTHLYFFFIAILFLAAWMGVEWFRQHFHWKKILTRTLFVILASVATVYGIIKITDPVHDRPKEVYGLLTYTATPKGTFLPWYGTWPETWKAILATSTPDLESKSYLGIAAVLLAPCMLFFALRGVIRWGKRTPDTSDKEPLPAGVLAWAGLLVWLFATGWFYQVGGTILVDAFPVLGQFRSLGRLAWIFYYCLNIYMVWFVFHAISGMRRTVKIAAIAIATIVLLIWIREANEFSREVTKGIFRPNTILRGETPYLDVLRSHDLKPEDFQAILQIPDILVGTENLTVMRGHWEFNKTMQCAWETGLPIVNYEMSRTSVEHALSLLQLISTPDIPKRRLADMNEKPLLLLSYISPHLPTEMRLIGLADSLGRVGTMDIYRLPLGAFTRPPMTDTVIWTTLVHEGFEDQPADHALSGKGALKAFEGVPYFTFKDETNGDSTMRFSCWVYIGAETPAFPAMRVVQTAPDGMHVDEQVHSIHSFDPWQVKGNWVEITFPLQPKMPGMQYTFSTLCKWALIDELVIDHQGMR